MKVTRHAAVLKAPNVAKYGDSAPREAYVHTWVEEVSDSLDCPEYWARLEQEADEAERKVEEWLAQPRHGLAE